MRILLANKFYYRRGGDCIYMLNLEQLLKEHGHEVAVFAMDYPENLNTPWKKYFVSNMDTERMGGKPKLRDLILHNEKWYIYKYVVALRHVEYYINGSGGQDKLSVPSMVV